MGRECMDKRGIVSRVMESLGDGLSVDTRGAAAGRVVPGLVTARC